MVRRTTGQSVRVSSEELASISSPSRVETPFGDFEFFDGLAASRYGRAGYEALDLLRAVDVFLNWVPGASMLAMRSSVIDTVRRSACPSKCSKTPTERIRRWVLAKSAALTRRPVPT